MAQAATRKNLSLKEAAAWYGVSERTMRRHVAAGRVPAFRVGTKMIRIRIDDLEALSRPITTAGSGGRVA